MPPQSQRAEDVRSLGSFQSETKPPASRERAATPEPVGPVRPPQRPRRVVQLIGALGSLAVIGIVAWSAWSPSAAAPATPKDGGLRVDSDPPGAEVLVDGVTRGSTPSAMRLA